MKFYTVLVAFTFIPLILNANFYTWEQFNVQGGLDISSVISDSEGRLYIGSWNTNNNGGVYRSDDDGITWVRKTQGMTSTSIISLEISPQGVIFAGGQNRVYRSENSGDSWTSVYNGVSSAVNFNVIRCGYDSIILVGGENASGIARSTDGGFTWENVLDISHYGWFETITDICFGPNNIIYASSRMILSDNPGLIYASNDYGKTWEIFAEVSNSYVMSLGFDNQGRLLRGQFGAGICRYDFSVSEWTHIIAENSSPADILVVPDNRIFLAGELFPNFYGGVLVSEDGGENYYYNNTGLLPSLNSGEQLAVDTTGRILLINASCLFRSYDTVFTDVQVGEPINKGYSCSPNPFSYETVFSFGTNVSPGVEVKVFNLFGKCIYRTLVKGTSELKWSPGNLPYGIYNVQFITKNSTSSLKLLHY